MSADSRSGLDATIHYLQELKAQGIQFVHVSPATLRALNNGGPASHITDGDPQPTGAVAGASPPPAITPSDQPVSASAKELFALSPSPSLAPPTALSPEAKRQAFAEVRERALVCVKCAPLAAS